MRADLFLVEHGHATTRSQAQRLIAAGVQWRVDEAVAWKKIAKNGDEIPGNAELQLLDTTEAKYISRGGLKLEGALKSVGLDVTGMRCLDIGQSTGGFTDCLLQHGAAQVVGVDVGHGQLHDSLRADGRVVCIEGVNARSLTADDLVSHYRRALHISSGSEDDFDEDFDDEESGDDEEEGDGFDPVFDFLTGDLSFISLTLVLPAVVRLLKAGGDLLMLVKPQFELQPGQIGKGGIVRDPAHFEFVEKRLRDTCASLGLDVLAWRESPIAGGDGNREFFIQARKSHDAVGEDQPLTAAPQRKAAKRIPRSELRASREPHEDSEAAHAGQHGPARRKQHEKKHDDNPTDD
ncbi:23S rRNA (cytidine1920-2'-O)/16S rRNA (cytidine1409-2'-O)-methyltransferase [Polaromonas sp. CG_9.5]|uniref:TlyA family RNA methyltransferase n=1 Tax=Polaromonas sp. CG_9.5 TaxID=3071705 RepID=UPI002E068AB8|nr:23S rRNA (cytidine1920-2'-O)/16S rRNA (cytidine1409-2'-O)-methyltransferase [Polaromonas sp. CG_9.5]